jgi:hypothetical protein
MINGPARPERDGFCAGCGEHKHTRRCVRKGHTVWLCEGCERPLVAVKVAGVASPAAKKVSTP